MALTTAAALGAQVGVQRILAVETQFRGTEGQEVRWPVAVAASSEGDIAVADAFESRLLLFRKLGTSWQLAATTSLPAPPAGLAWDGSRWVVSLRSRQGLIALEGDRLQQRRLRLPVDSVPGAIAALPDGGLLVVDLVTDRLLKLDPDGRVTGEIAVGGRATAVAPAADGGFYLALSREAAVVRFDRAGELTARWPLPGNGPVPAWPVALAVSPGGEVAAVDRHGGRILVLDNSGKLVGVGARRGWEQGLLSFPSAMTRLADGRLVVADQGNGRIQVFRRTDRIGAP